MKDASVPIETSVLRNPQLFFGVVAALSLALFAMAPAYMVMLAIGIIFATATEPLVEKLQRRLNMLHERIFVSHSVAATLFVALALTGTIIALRIIIPLCIEGLSQLFAMIPRDAAWWQEMQASVKMELEKILPEETVAHMLSRVKSVNTGQVIATYSLSIMGKAGAAAEHILILVGSWLFSLMAWKRLTLSADNTLRRAWPILAHDSEWIFRRFQENLSTLGKMIIISGSIFSILFLLVFLSFGKSLGLSIVFGLIFGLVACVPTIGPLLVYPLAAILGAFLFVAPEFMSRDLVWTWPEILETLALIWKSKGVWKWFFLMFMAVFTHFLESWLVTPYFMEKHLKINAMYLMAVLGAFVYFVGLSKGVVFGLSTLVLMKSWDEFQDYIRLPTNTDTPEPLLEVVEPHE